jgi:histidyl-tRNA synthetase
VILGDDEAAAAEVTLKPLREAAEQVRATLAQATDFLKKA